MNRCTKLAPITFLFTGWILWPLQFVTGEYPKMPSEERLNWGGDSEGHWTHAGNNFWTEFVRANAEHTSKFMQFVVWWTVFSVWWTVFSWTI